MNWKQIYEKSLNDLDVEKIVGKPAEWQLAFVDHLASFLTPGAKVFEAGCGGGVTSLLLGSEYIRTLLDLEPSALEMAKTLFERCSQEASFVVGDLFDIPLPENSYDLVFNSGVLEHFNVSERRAAIIEMKRMVCSGGIICVAIPNHYSTPYRFAYESRKRRGKWRYPDEEMIFDFSEELKDVSGIETISRITVAPKSAFSYLKGLQKVFFKLSNIFARYEGYLTIITMRKK